MYSQSIDTTIYSDTIQSPSTQGASSGCLKLSQSMRIGTCLFTSKFLSTRPTIHPWSTQCISLISSLQHVTVGIFHYCSHGGRPRASWTFPPHNTSIYVGGPCKLALLLWMLPMYRGCHLCGRSYRKNSLCDQLSKVMISRPLELKIGLGSCHINAKY